MKDVDRVVREIVIMSAWILVVAVAIIILFHAVGLAETREETWEECYVVCQPNDYVNARMSPSRRSQAIGRFDTGDRLYTDGTKKNGFLHIVHAGLEMDEAWVHSGYIVYDKPEWMNRGATVTSRARLAARKTVDGKVRKWLKTGNHVRVYWLAGEWSVTNVGYVKSEFLEMEGE